MTLADRLKGMKAQKAARKKREREKARKEIERRIERNEQTAAHQDLTM